MGDDALFCSKCGKQLSSTKKMEMEESPVQLQETNQLQDNETDLPVQESVQKEGIKKGEKKTGKKIFLTVLALGLILGGWVAYRKVFVKQSVEAYIEKNYPLYEAAKNRFNESVDKYNERYSSGAAENSSRAGLDMIEAYLDYYKGMVKVQGAGDYSDMNKYMEETIALVESNHSIHGLYRTSTTLGGFTFTYGETEKFRDYFDKRIESLKAEWKRVKR